MMGDCRMIYGGHGIFIFVYFFFAIPQVVENLILETVVFFRRQRLELYTCMNCEMESTGDYSSFLQPILGVFSKPLR